MKEFFKNFLKLSFNLAFTTSKLLAYIIVGLGSYISLELKSDTPFTLALLASTALFGIKNWSSINVNNKEKI
jgi:hypothetical protein